jgi:integrase/recombinase XerD
MDLRCAYTEPNQSLFVTAGSKALKHNGLALNFFWQYRKDGIDGASSHIGRRSFLTNLVAKCIGGWVLASLAGHRNLAVTMKYIDASDDMKRNAVELI